MKNAPKKLVIALTGRSSFEIDPNEWPVIASNRDNNVQKPEWKLVVRRGPTSYLVYGIHFFQDAIKPKPVRAGEIVYSDNKLAATLVQVGEAINAPAELVQQVIQKLPPQEAQAGEMPDFLFLGNSAVIEIKTEEHSQNEGFEHLSLTAVDLSGKSYQTRVTQQTGRLQRDLQTQNFFIETLPLAKLICFKRSAICSATIVSEDAIPMVEVHTVVGAKRYVPRDTVDVAIKRLWNLDSIGLVKSRACCANCIHMTGLVTDGSLGSTVSAGTFYCHHTEDVGMISDRACCSFENDDSMERKVELHDWSKEGLL